MTPCRHWLTLFLGLTLPIPAIQGQALTLANVTSDSAIAGTDFSPIGEPGASERRFIQGLNAPANYRHQTQTARSWYSPTRTFNVAVLADGYRSHEKWRFDRLFQRALAGLARNEVLAETGLGNRLTLYPVFLESTDSGASHHGWGLRRRTALNATYHERHADDTTISVNFDYAWFYARYARVPVHAVLVLVNDGKYAATNWSNKVCVIPDFNSVTGRHGTSTFEDILGHEFLGHAVGNLWDEYTYGGHKDDPSTHAPNCDTNPRNPKWQYLLGWQWVNRLWSYIYVGAFHGCTNGNHYRPTRDNCRMNARASNPFCTVCYHQIYRVLSRL